jgi:CheY-like chemotaxis protein
MRRILFIDDDFAVAEVTQMVLEHEGFSVSIAVNGEDALRAAETEVPDLIITDYMMPIMNGGELVRRVRASARLSAVPIIMATANEPSEIPEVPMCNYVLRKPITLRKLLGAIQRVLAPHDKPDGA